MHSKFKQTSAEPAGDASSAPEESPPSPGPLRPPAGGGGLSRFNVRKVDLNYKLFKYSNVIQI